ncbi:MAG: tyrosine-type recombinase/integrase [Candidatus Bathyarchaeota archaeon]|nr:MAG: tyrosine-type recombinase/integrase [Candidatus Bathyarchaeota archaeon]
MQGKVNKLLSDYQNKNTKRNLKRAILEFFISVYQQANPNQLDELADKYFSEQRDHERDVEVFLKSLNGQAPLTVKLKISNVKTFLMENDIELTQKFWRKINRRIKGSRALTLDKVPSNKQLRKVLSHMPIHGKALSLLLSSSGMRLGEALGITLKDIDLQKEPVRIEISGKITKTGNSRYAFASREAKEAIVEWLKVRDQYLQTAKKRSHQHPKRSEDDRLFPFETSTVYMIWTGSLEKTQLAERDNQTNRNKIHPHVLRKFFRTRLGAVIPVDVVEAIMGHEGYLTEVYRRYTVDDLAKFYLQGETALLIFTEAQEVTKLRKEINEQNKKLQTLVTELTTKNLTLENKVSAMEKESLETKQKNEKLTQRVESLEKIFPEVEKLKNQLTELIKET